MADSKNKLGLFKPIQSHDEAQQLIKYASQGFYFVAGLQIIVGLLLGVSAVVDGILYAVLGFFLHKFQSRVAATLLLLMSAGATVMTVMNKLGLSDTGGTNIFLALIVLIMSVRAVEATFKLHGKLRQAHPVPPYTARHESPTPSQRESAGQLH